MSDEKRMEVGVLTQEMCREIEAAYPAAIPKNCKRLIIDIGYVGEPVTVYWETFSDMDTLRIQAGLAVKILRLAKTAEERARDSDVEPEA